jgi:hypothetical protein
MAVALAVTRSDSSGAGVGACLSAMPVADAGRTLVVPPGAAARRNCGGAKTTDIASLESLLLFLSSAKVTLSVTVAAVNAGAAKAGMAGAAPIRSAANEAGSDSRLNAAMAAVSGVAPRCTVRRVAAALRADWALARSDADRMDALDADEARRGVWCDDSGLDDAETRDAVDDDEPRSEPVDDEAARDIVSGSRNPLSCKRDSLEKMKHGTMFKRTNAILHQRRINIHRNDFVPTATAVHRSLRLPIDTMRSASVGAMRCSQTEPGEREPLLRGVRRMVEI